MAMKPIQEFGRRRPAAIPTAPPVKRSGHVALLLMSTVAIGGSAYALMPRQRCEPRSPGMAAPATPDTNCRIRNNLVRRPRLLRQFDWSRSSFYGGDTAANRSSSGGAGDSGSGGVTRGGFGSFARAFSAHFSGGG